MVTKSQKNGNSLVMDDSSENMSTHLGYDLLGPVIQRWLLSLYQYISYFDDGETAFLYCARAGVRIDRLYNIFLQGIGAENKGQLLWASRISVAKGLFIRNRLRSLEAISREYHHHPMRELVRGVLRHNPKLLENLDLNTRDLDAHGFNFTGWLEVKGRVQNTLRDYLEQCSDAFDSYFQTLVGDSKRVILIDSGWQGSTQSLLSGAYPELAWKGLYFGRILTANHDPVIVPDVIGLMFEHDHYEPIVPESAFAAHRHIIESVLEPNGYSIEEIPAGPFRSVAENLIRSNEQEEPDLVKDRLYLEVVRYLEDHAGASISEIFANHQAAMPNLARVIVQPTREEAKALYCKDRSADFGKKSLVPVLIHPEGCSPDERDIRIQNSLWPQGQAALEYERGISREIQMRITGLIDDAVHFDPNASDEKKGKDIVDEGSVRPKVAIITRTKNRPILLQRAANSVAHQTYTDYLWVIVNDGGDEAIVREVINNCLVDRQRILLVSNSRSLGMEAASNAGINASDSEYVVIHDDDDSWDPQFLKCTVDYLEKNRRYGGVITHCLYVSEEIRGDSVIEHGRWPYNDWVRNVQLAEMACNNFFAPIAFLYRRSIWKEVGGYNENLPVLGDWFFNMDFLLKSDIGVVIKPLAFYHHRDRGDSRSGLYSNSVIGGVSKHEEFAAVARNEFLRKHASDSNAALSVVIGHYTDNLRGRMDQVLGSGHGSFSAAKTPSANTEAYDLVDRYWVIAHINYKKARRKYKQKLLAVDSRWSQIIAALTKTELRRELPPPENFDENGYLSANGDVAEAVRNGRIESGYIHYIIHGRKEGRPRTTKDAHE